MEHTELQGGAFRLFAYFKRGAADIGEEQGGRLHVYIDHDGSPWLAGRVSADPTPRNPLALRLIAQDTVPALYVGRPCHFEVDVRSVCNPLLWTHARYGEAVVAGMAQAIRAFAARGRFHELVLVGYSGGGTVAVLLAERLEQTVAVVTLAANLDVDGWVRLHGHSPLTDSLNPATRPSLDSSIIQLHLVGDADRNVPPALLHRYVARRPAASVVEVAGFDHVCCWEDAWSGILLRHPFR